MIDLSMLTPEEQQQFNENPIVLTKGDHNVALYMRYSSERQTEQSIEGQLRDLIAYCKLKSYRVTAVYIDRATSARTIKNRQSFLKMMDDSDGRNWEYVVVWKLDRFARNRNDSAVYKMRLNKNNVKVISATEDIGDSPESIILESVLEGMAEFYSAELSQKILRGMREAAYKCHNIGGLTPLGYKIENHKLTIDPLTAPIVQEAFELYAEGWTVADICRQFNAKGYRTSTGTEFNRNSFKSMFRNKRYIGTYTYRDIEIENGIPAIISKDLFDKVQQRIKKSKDAPARSKAKVPYLLSGKIFCGHCGTALNGDNGRSQNGNIYYYYSCRNRKAVTKCGLKAIPKDAIENRVVQDALELLTDDVIDKIATIAVEQAEKDIKENTRIPAINAEIKEISTSINNISKAIEKGAISDTLVTRLTELEQRKKFLGKQLVEEEKGVIHLEKDHVVFWLSQFKNGNIENQRFRRQLVNLMVNSVTIRKLDEGYEITTAYNLTAMHNKTYRVEDGLVMDSKPPPILPYPNFSIVGHMGIQMKRLPCL